MVDRLGINTTFHKLRHYSATELIRAGVDIRTVAGRLGHAEGGATPIPEPGGYLLVGGAVAFLLAAVLALVTNAPLRHRAIDPSSMVRSMREHWADDEQTARARVTATRTRLLATTRSANDLKALVLLTTMTAEVLGTALLGATVCMVLLRA